MNVSHLLQYAGTRLILDQYSEFGTSESGLGLEVYIGSQMWNREEIKSSGYIFPWLTFQGCPKPSDRLFFKSIFIYILYNQTNQPTKFEIFGSQMY